MDQGFKSKFGPGNMKMSQYLRSCGLLEAYEKLMTGMYVNGWPGDRSIYSYAAEEILRYGSKYQQEFKGVIGKEFEKKTRVIEDTYEGTAAEKPKSIVSVKRNPIEVKSKNSLDLSIFDKPRVQLSRSSKATDRLRESKKDEDEFLQLNLTKPEKRDIIMADEPDFTLDKNYYEEEFQRNPENDEDLIRFSLKASHRDLEQDVELNDSTLIARNGDETYQRERDSQLRGRMSEGAEDGVNIGGDTISEERYNQENYPTQNEAEREDYEQELNEINEFNKNQSIDHNQKSESRHSIPQHHEDEGDNEERSNRTPLSKASKDKTPKSKQSDKQSKKSNSKK